MDRQEWDSLIIDNPCIINLGNRLSQIVTEVGRVSVTCELNSSSSTRKPLSHHQRIWQSSYAVIIKAEQVIGVLTAQEIVGWLSTQKLNQDCQLSSIFSGSVVPLCESDLTEQVAVIQLLQQRQASCLPIVDAQKQLVGLLTTESVASFSQPLAPLRLQKVGDVMQGIPTMVGWDCSIWAIAQLMTEKNSSVLVLPLVEKNIITQPGTQQAWGIIQAQDIVQLLALGVELNRVQAVTIMQPIATITPEETLWSAYQQIDRQGGYPLAVTSPQGDLVGLLSLDNLLQAFDPLALYRLSEVCAAQLDTRLDTREAIAPTIQSAQVNQPSLSLSTPITESVPYESLMAASPVGILRTDAMGVCTYANDRYCEILGLDRTALIGQPWSVGYRYEDLERIVAEYEKARRENRSWSIEYRVQRPDGSEVWVYGQSVVEYNAEGEEIGFVGTITDISDRKRAEALLESQYEILERIAQTQPLSGSFDALMRAMENYLPETVCTIMLCKDGQLCQATAPSLPQDYVKAAVLPIAEGVGTCGTAAHRREIVIAADIDTDPLCQDYKHLALAYGLQSCWSMPILSSDQTLLGVLGIYYRQKKTPQSHELECVRKVAHLARIAIEREQSTQAIHQLNQKLEQRVTERTAALQASEERWQLALKGANDGIWDWNPQTKQLFVSQRLKEMRGYDDDELPSDLEDWVQLVHPDDRNLLYQAIADHLAGNTEFFQLEYRVRHKDGSYLWILSRAQAQWDTTGKAIRIIGSESDITQRKQAELALQESEKLYATLAEVAPVAICRFDAPMNCVYVSDRWSEMTGRPLKSALGQGWLEAVHPEDRERLLAPWNNPAILADLFVPTSAIQGVEGRHIRPDGSINWVYIQARPEFDDQGQICGCISTLTDITQLKQIEAELAASEAKYRQLVEGGQDLVWAVDVQDRFTYLSPQFQTLFGWEPSEWIGKPSLDAVYPDDRDWLIAQRTQPSINSEDSYLEFRHRHRDRPYLWVRVATTPVKDTSGKIIGYQGILTDITDRKNVEFALQESERRYASLAAAAPVAIFRFDTQGNCIYVNERWSQMTGRPIESALGQGWLNALHPEEREVFRVKSLEVMERFSPDQQFLQIGEGRHLLPDGTINWFYSQVVQEIDEAGNLIGYVRTLTDITQLKQIEAKLAASEAKFRRLVEGGQDVIWSLDSQWRFTYLSPQFQSLSGWEAREWINQSCIEAVYPDDRETVLAHHVTQNKQSTKTDLEFRMRHRDRPYVWVRISSSPILDATGELLGYQGILTDITDRKYAQLALQESERRYASLAAAAPVAIFRFDTQGNCIYVNERWSQMTGRPAESALGQGWLNALHPEERNQALASWKLILEMPTPNIHALEPGEGRHVKPDGTINWIYSRVVPEFNEAGCLVGYVGTLTDITDRKRMEAELAESEAKFRRLVEGGQDLIWSIDIEQRFTYLSPQFKTLFGWEPSEWIGRLVAETIYAEDRPQILEQTPIRQVSTEIGYIEFRHRHRDRPYVWVRANTTPIKDTTGKIIGYQGILTDITSRKNAELALQESQAQFHRLTENVPGVIIRYVLHPDGTDEITYVSSQIREVFEIEPETALQDITQVWARIHPEDISWLSGEIRRNAADLPQPTTVSYRLLLPQKGLRWVQDMSYVERLDNGDVVWDGIIFDVSDRKQVELALQQEVLRRATIFNTSSDGIHIIDSEANLLEANASFFHMLGYSPEEARHFNVADWDAQMTLEEVRSNLSNFSWDTSKARKIETLHSRKDGSIFPVEIYICPMEWDRQLSFICISRDISERKQAEAQLQKTNEELIRATRLKDEFLANMSHELRTPLNAILGMSETLQEEILGSLNERQMEMVRIIERSGEHLLSLISDILDLAKIEAGQIVLESLPVDVAQLCQASIVFVQQQALKKNIQLDIQLPSSPLPDLYLDDRRIRQVLINLLNNAVKFTPEGGQVTLQVVAPYELEEVNNAAASANSMLQLSVIDTGIGIAPEDIPKLFQAFSQIDGALNRKYEGTGLGLALVKRIVELHGGEVHLTSKLGVGSCFTIRLPYRPLEIIDAINPKKNMLDDLSLSANIAQSAGIKILLAEDNEENMAVIVDYLEIMGYGIFVARNGQEAIELTQKLHPDLVLMDIQMPGIDGLEAIRKIRQIPELSQIPIIALTALAMPGDEARCLDSGATGYLSKPIRLKNLNAKIQSCLAGLKT
ncbi:PAS domain S-box protein [Calothrix sp. 336/3]|uniref:PAS domain S-box protein n=1 Tax=Calothrix sp. 336/3 TaxID=1337936 RepID=UPI0004E36EE3|nr:PAS domain S-box protein [Calothrix sp. 336/3]AKG23037.1 hypothetical protein IJ00_18765 [Calothrix sp. 336/3]